MTTHQTVSELNALPTDTHVGRVARWTLPSGNDVVEIVGEFLGISTSYQPQHHYHRGTFADAGDRCRACRWFEPRIFRESGGARRYLIHRTGRSAVPGEVA